MKTTVNERIKMLRTSLNLTQSEFSEIVGLTNTQLSRIENGNGAPQNATLKGILDNIDVSKDWLLNGTGELNPQINIKSKLANNNSQWKDEAYFEVKSKNAILEKELERLWQMVQHLTGGAKPNFRKALNLTDFSKTKAFKAPAYS